MNMGHIYPESRSGAEESTLTPGVHPLLHIRDTTLSIKSNSWKLLFFLSLQTERRGGEREMTETWRGKEVERL